ncbi:MAG: cysteine desulfurase family protein [Oscillospiraceae bacterium]|nr:cysteine desulfurase family protein [Oscillospiraceae bacterium]
MVYLDNAATTRPSDAVCDTIGAVLRARFGNPSSLYDLGFEAQKELDAARGALAGALGCDAAEVYFTGSGTEANNIAVLGAARARKAWGGEVIATGYEHPSVENSLRQLEREGFRVTRVAPSADGGIDERELVGCVTRHTSLVAMMLVNNETGAMLPVERIAAQVRRINARTAIHCDDVQGFMKHPLDVRALDTVSVSAHKIHGPKGMGALYVRRGLHVENTLFGGLQERGLRPGTENVAYAAGFAEAVRGCPDMRAALARISALSARLRAKVSALPGAVLNSPAGASPYILNFSLPGYKSETMLRFLASRGVYVSSASACGRGEKSRTLLAMGLPDERVDAALRVSFCAESGEEDVDALCAGLEEALRTLAKTR